MLKEKNLPEQNLNVLNYSKKININLIEDIEDYLTLIEDNSNVLIRIFIIKSGGGISRFNCGYYLPHPPNMQLSQWISTTKFIDEEFDQVKYVMDINSNHPNNNGDWIKELFVKSQAYNRVMRRVTKKWPNIIGGNHPTNKESSVWASIMEYNGYPSSHLQKWIAEYNI